MEDLIKRAQLIQANRRQLRQKEQSLRARKKLLSSQPLVSDSPNQLRASLEKILPKHLIPTNIGDYNEVMWPFWIPFDYDFGTDPTYDINSRISKSIQITQESAFLLTGISRTHNSRGISGEKAPLQITIRDNQSSRQFNDKAIPLQTIGFESEITKVDTPLFIAPNASLTIEMSSWLGQGQSVPTIGSGFHQIILSGWRIRTDNAHKVLSSIFL